MKAKVRKDHRAICEMLNHRLEVAVMDIGSGKVSSNDHPEVIEQPAQFSTHDPASVGETFFANLFLRAPLTDWMDQFNSITVDDAQQTRLNQETQRPIPMSCKQAEQTRSFG